MAEIYTSGMTILKEHADSLETKASSDLEQIKSTISGQISELENV